jgi:hypothetical protein
MFIVLAGDKAKIASGIEKNGYRVIELTPEGDVKKSANFNIPFPGLNKRGKTKRAAEYGRFNSYSAALCVSSLRTPDGNSGQVLQFLSCSGQLKWIIFIRTGNLR